MKTLFKPSIDDRGGWIRGLGAVVLLVAAGFGASACAWLAAGVFVAFEALRGWCSLRACGVETEL